MEEVFLVFLGLTVLVLLVAGPILGVVAYLKARRLARELAELRAELRLERERPARATLPQAALEEVAEPAPEPAAPPPPSEPVAGSPPAPAGVEEPFRPPERRPARRWLPDLRSIDWERWIGVRGAAVVGGIVLALAAILFFAHAFTSGWISPPMRVACGVGAGIAAIAWAWRLRGRAFVWAPSALEGAGVVALYASVWAADRRYALLSTAASFPLMALVTALACGLALRHRSLFTALLGLAGGFATPLLLSGGQDRPMTLFGYVLLLDLGLVLVGQRRRWPSIGILALLATVGMEALWIFLRMGDRLTLGLAIVAVFAGLFTLAGALTSSEERRRWFGTQALSVLLPFVFASYFAGRLKLETHVWPTGLLLGLLVLAGAWVARQQGAAWLGQAVALASVAVVGLWFSQRPQVRVETLWELVAVASGLALVSHALAEWERARSPGANALRLAAATSGCAWMLVVLWARSEQRTEGFVPLLAGLVAVAALLVRQAVLLVYGPLVLVAALGLGLGLGLSHAGYGRLTTDSGNFLAYLDATLPDPWLFWVLPAVPALLFLLALPRVVPALERWSWRAVGALLLPFVLVALLVAGGPQYRSELPWLVPAAAPVLGAISLLAAARLSSSPWVAGSVLLTTVLSAMGWIGVQPLLPRSEETLLAVLIAAVSGPAVLLVLAAFLLPWLRERRWAWAFVAGLVPFSFLHVKELYVARYGEGFDAGPHLLLAAPAALAALRLRSAGAPRGALGWMTAAILLALTSAIADQVDHEEFTVSAALMALGLAWLARALALPAAGWTAAALSGLVMLVLIGAALDPGHHEASSRFLVHWITYAHVVPAAAIGGAVWLLGSTVPASRKLAALYRGAPALSVVAIAFLWLNFLIENAYSVEPCLSLGSDALAVSDIHARDLVTSLAWGLYALVLLLLGTLRRITALRWTSLAFLVLSLGKVFLYDLDHLEGLYRVASLAGLALSLIGVSLFYQRFGFRRETPGTPAAA